MDEKRLLLATLYQRYGAVVHRRARRLLGDEQAAEDATHEVFMRLFAAWPTFTDASPVRWLFQVTTNHCLNVIRDGQRHRRLLEERAAGSAIGSSEIPLTLLLRNVPEELQRVSVYYYVDEMSQDEIAEVLGVSQRTVSSWLREFRSLFQADSSTEMAEVI